MLKPIRSSRKPTGDQPKRCLDPDLLSVQYEEEATEKIISPNQPYPASVTSTDCLTSWHGLSVVRKAMSAASRPLPMRTRPSIGARRVGSTSHQPPSR